MLTIMLYYPNLVSILCSRRKIFVFLDQLRVSGVLSSPIGSRAFGDI